MDEEFKKRLKEVGADLLTWAQQGGAFVKEQAPLYAQELLAWEFWSSALLMIPGLTFTVVSFLLIRSGARIWRENDGKAFILQKDPFNAMFPGIICGIIALAVVATAAHGMVKVTVAPRVVLVEKLQGIFK